VKKEKFKEVAINMYKRISGYRSLSKKILCVLVIFALLCLLTTACAPSKQRISIATGGTGGTYYPYGGAMASIINKYISNLDASAEVTGASVENSRLIESNESQLALVMDDVVYHALHGEGAFDHEIELRTLVEMYPHFFHIVVHEGSAIQTVEDLEGTKVSVGAPGSGTETMSQQVLEALGLTYDKFDVFRLSFTENTEGLRDRVIDAGIWSVGPPTASIMDLATTHDIRIINFTDEQLAAVQEKYPYYLTMKLDAGTYQGVDEELIAPSVWNSVVVGKNMPEEQAYEIVKALFEHKDELEQVYVGASWTTPENTIDYAIAPLHPGAIRYFKEIGLEVPDKLIPPEME
jgi:TRAP transporter TAXI family solute receptor